MTTTSERLRGEAARLWRLLEPGWTVEKIEDRVASVAARDLEAVVAKLKYRLEERLFWQQRGPHAATRAAERWCSDD